METKNITKNFVMLFLILSLVLIIPMNLSYANEPSNPPLTNTGLTEKKQISNECSLVPPLNVKDSFILSTVMMCIPGVLEKAHEYRNIKCQVVVCKYEAVKNGLDPTFCTKEGAFNTCKYIVGEVFAIPPMSILENLRKVIADALANPVGIMYSVVSMAIRKYLPQCGNSYVCGAGNIMLTINEISSIVQTFQDIKENGFFPKSEDYCSDLDDIVEELEEVVKSME